MSIEGSPRVITRTTPNSATAIAPTVVLDGFWRVVSQTASAVSSGEVAMISDASCGGVCASAT